MRFERCSHRDLESLSQWGYPASSDRPTIIDWYGIGCVATAERRIASRCRRFRARNGIAPSRCRISNSGRRVPNVFTFCVLFRQTDGCRASHVFTKTLITQVTSERRPINSAEKINLEAINTLLWWDVIGACGWSTLYRQGQLQNNKPSKDLNWSAVPVALLCCRASALSQRANVLWSTGVNFHTSFRPSERAGFQAPEVWCKASVV